MPAIGLIGVGMIGSTLARLWARAGYSLLASARSPDKPAALAAEFGAAVRAATALETAQQSDVVLLSIPLHEVARLPPEVVKALAGKVVLDTNNPSPARDGEAGAEAAARGSGAWVAAHLPGARVVKAFNTVYFKTLESKAHARDRVAIPIAGDDAAALDVASKLVLAAGFEPLYVGALDKAKSFDAGTPAYNTGANARELKRLLGIAPGLSVEAMKAFVLEHFEDFVNRGKTEVALRNLGPEFLDHDEPMGPTLGPQPAKAMMDGAHQRWPDLHVQVEEILAEDDKVMVRNRWTATDPASRQPIEFHGFVLWRFAHGQIVERWATVTAPQPGR